MKEYSRGGIQEVVAEHNLITYARPSRTPLVDTEVHSQSEFCLRPRLL